MITVRDGILEGFEPKFKSISKDADRYFDALVACSESGSIRTDQVIALSGAGTLWITYQYIDNGFLDLVEADMIRTVTSRDFFGPLFENTRLILNRLLLVAEPDRVIKIYRAAIKHRLNALKSISATRKKAQKQPDRIRAEQWADTYIPALETMLQDYRALLVQIDKTDPELAEFDQMFQRLETAFRTSNG